MKRRFGVSEQAMNFEEMGHLRHLGHLGHLGQKESVLGMGPLTGRAGAGGTSLCAE